MEIHLLLEPRNLPTRRKIAGRSEEVRGIAVNLRDFSGTKPRLEAKRLRFQFGILHSAFESLTSNFKLLLNLSLT